MSFNCCRHVCWLRLMFGAASSMSCANERVAVHADTGVHAVSLELECADAPADAAGDVLAILSSIDPLDTSEPQTYGSEHCGGFVFEFDNPDEEELRGAWIQASADELSEDDCVGRVLEADYWGFAKREWTKLASVASMAGFESAEVPGSGHCRLDGLIEHAGVFERYRIVARVAKGAETYPMYACVW